MEHFNPLLTESSSSHKFITIGEIMFKYAGGDADAPSRQLLFGVGLWNSPEQGHLRQEE